MTELMSNRCQFCGDRVAVAPGYDRETERRHHEGRCELSVDCGYCNANVGQPCQSSSGKRVRPHSSRRWYL